MPKVPGSTHLIRFIPLTFEERVDLLCAPFRAEMARRPLQVEAMVVLPDHLHCLW